MPTHFEPAAGLDEMVALRFLRPTIDRAKGEVERLAQANAPHAKVWITMRDERVRHSHVETDGQIIPANLRYRLPKVEPGVGVDLARVPGDPNLPAAQRINCRCNSVAVPWAVARSIHATPTLVMGTRVSAQVETRFPRAAESEFGTESDEAAHFMGRAVEQVRVTLLPDR